MSSISSVYTRTSTLMASDRLGSQLRETQRQLFEAQQQISSGVRYSTPSDAPHETSAILFLRQRLAEREQHNSNLDRAETMLNNVDSALQESSTILRDAKSVALSQIGVGSDSATRETTALTIDAKLQGLLELANRQFNNVSLFGGRASAAAGGHVFESFMGGVRYLGSTEDLETNTSLDGTSPLTSNGNSAFGACRRASLRMSISIPRHQATHASASSQGARRRRAPRHASAYSRWHRDKRRSFHRR